MNSFAFSADHFATYHPNAVETKMNIQPATSRKILLTAVIATVLGGIGPSLASAQLANINPIKDNTLYQYDPAEGDVSNALGQHFFAGETGMGELRRGVLAFDILASAVYGVAGLAHVGPPERDTRAMALSLRVNESFPRGQPSSA